jgi:hypothetical protein
VFVVVAFIVASNFQSRATEPSSRPRGPDDIQTPSQPQGATH